MKTRRKPFRHTWPLDSNRQIVNPKFDSQRAQSIYMERETCGGLAHHRAPAKYLRDALAEVCRTWAVPLTTIVFKNDSESDVYASYRASVDKPYIEINSHGGGMTLGTLLHETAHHIVWCRYRERAGYQDHGPQWAWVYMKLLAQFQVLPEEAFRLLARKHQLKVRQPR